MHARVRNVKQTKQTNTVKQLMDGMDASGIFFGTDVGLTWPESPWERMPGTRSSASGPRRSSSGLSRGAAEAYASPHGHRFTDGYEAAVEKTDEQPAGTQ